MLQTTSGDRPRGWRRARTAAGAVALAAAALLAAAHLPWAQERASRWAVGYFARAAGIDARVGRVRYNLLTRHARLDDVRLAVPGSEAQPFLQARSVDVSLPWSTLAGRVSIASLAIDAPRILYLRRANGSTNWPPASSTASSIVIREAHVRDLGVAWRDDQVGARADVEGASLDLLPRPGSAAGTLTLPRPMRVAWRGRETTVAGRADVSWDGTRLAIAAAHVAAPELTLDVRGAVGVLDARPGVDLTYEATADLAAASAWTSVDPRPSGVVTARGRVTGLLASPRAELIANGSGLAWRDFTGMAVSLDGAADAHGLDVKEGELRAAGGLARVKGRVAFDDRDESRLAIDWRDVDAARLLRAAGAATGPKLAATLDGRASASWKAWQASAVTGTLDLTTRPVPAARGRLGLRGTVSLAARDGDWHATIDEWLDEGVHAQGRAGGRVSSAALARSTLAGDLSAAADDPAKLWHTLVTLGVVDRAAPADLAGRVRVDVGLDGTLGEPAADARLAVVDWRQDGVGPLGATGRATVTRHEAAVGELEARIGANTLRASGTASFDSGRLAGRVDATLPALDQIVASRSPMLRPSGGLELSATIGGRLSSPSLEGRMAGTELALAGQHADRLRGAFRLTAHTLTVDQLELAQTHGQLDASGSFEFATRRFAAHATARRVAVAPVPGDKDVPLAPVSATLDADLAVSGTVDDPRGGGRIALDDAQWEGRKLGRITGTLAIADRRLVSELQLPDLFTTATASVALNPFGAFSGDARLAAADLAALASRLAIPTRAPVAGTASLGVHAEGTIGDWRRVRASLEVRDLNATAGGVAVRAAGGGRLSYDEDGITADEVKLAVGGSELRVGGRLGRTGGGTLRASLDGSLDDLMRAALSFGQAPPGTVPPRLSGRVSILAHVTGTIDRPVIDATARVDDGMVAIGSMPPFTGVAVRASYAGGIVDLSQLGAAWQGATLVASGRAPLTALASNLPDWLARIVPRDGEPGRLTARLESVTPAVLSPWLSADARGQLGGLMSGTLTLSATAPTLESASGELVLDRAELSAAGVRFDQQRPTRLALARGRLRVADLTWGGEGNRVTVGGDIGLGADASLNVSVGGAVDLRALGAFLPEVRTAGEAVLDARVTGTLGAPRVDGYIDVRRGELRNASPPLVVSDLAGRLTLSNDALTIADLSGTANGGALDLAGRVRFPGWRLTDGRIAITARGVAMALPDPLKTEVDADLSLGLAQGRLSLGGDVIVLGGSYREPLSLAGGLLQALQQTQAPLVLGEPSLVDAMTLDVRITTADDIVVDNNYAQLALAGDVHVRGTVANPALLGRALAREGGRFFLGGRVYQLVGDGAIDFTNPSRMEPTFSINAVTRVSGYDINLSLAGTPEQLDTALTSPSDPSLSQSDLVSLLATGNKPAEGTSTPAIGRDQLLAYLSGEFLGVAGRAVGLDTLRVEQGSDVRFDAGLIASETDPSSRLTFGKQVTREVELVFSQNLRDSGAFTWIVAYRPRHNLELRVVSLDNNDRIYDFRHDLVIGGAPAAVSAKRIEPPRVGAIRFTGEALPDGGPLKDELKLTEGDRFDFFRWQQDRERLERYWRDREYLQARVVATRSTDASGAAPRVDIDYEVRRGPKTTVEIAGAPDPSAVRKAVEAVWSGSAFDAFLRDEATAAARGVLVDEGYLRATVTASLDARSGGDESHLTVTVAPGERFDRRRVAFAGNQSVATDALDALVKARGLDRSAWLDSTSLERVVTAYYRDEGFHAARITVGAPVFGDRTATLPVTIDEGPAFRVAAIAFSGVAREPEADVRDAFSLRPGDVLTRAAVERSVLRLGGFYRTRGFSRVSVAVASRRAEGPGAAMLAVEVDEGARQVLRDVVIEGTRRAKPALVSRELRFDVGQPVDPAALEQARKRLYDAGVFRQVGVDTVPADPAEERPATGDEPVRARVTVEEWPPLSIRYGVELNDQGQPASEPRRFSPGVAGDLTYRNPFGRAATTGVALRYTKDFRAARAFASTPSFFGLPLTSNVFLSRSREDVGATFTTDKSEITAEQRFRAGRRLQFAYSYNFERNHTFDVNAVPDDPFAFDLTINIARLTGTGIFDTRDDLVDATRGDFLSSTFEYGAAALGSDLRFAKYFLQESYYRRLWPGVVFATSGRLGLAAGFDQDLIPSERFFAGGGNSVRGYREASLGPRDFFGDATGGNALLVLNEELRFPLVWRLRGVAFVDAGNAFATIGDVALGDLRVGTGFGVRVQTPFALLRVDFGAPLGRRPDEPRTRWFFSIGQVF